MGNIVSCIDVLPVGHLAITQTNAQLSNKPSEKKNYKRFESEYKHYAFLPRKSVKCRLFFQTSVCVIAPSDVI